MCSLVYSVAICTSLAVLLVKWCVPSFELVVCKESLATASIIAITIIITVQWLHNCYEALRVAGKFVQ